jgi:glycosyltransferase involved in cell wall biosynthesis
MARRSLGALVRSADRVVVHDDLARGLVLGRFRLHRDKVVNIARPPETGDASKSEPARTFLYFGGIDHFKGVGDLVHAFDAFSDSIIDQFRLEIVGSVHNEFPVTDLVESARHRDRITVDLRWVPDDEVDDIFEQADVVVLPYRSTWTTGPLDVAMRLGKQVVLTRAEGVANAAPGYTKRTLAEPGNIASLTVALERAARLSRDRVDSLRDWTAVERDYIGVIEASAGRHRGTPPRLLAY